MLSTSDRKVSPKRTCAVANDHIFVVGDACRTLLALPADLKALSRITDHTTTNKDGAPPWHTDGMARTAS